MKTYDLINDEQYFKGATNSFGRTLPIYDDGYGPLWIHRDSMGISGIVRARSWDDAYSICEDEFFPEADETVEELEKEFSTQYLSGRELWLYDFADSHPGINREVVYDAWMSLPSAAKNTAYSQGRDVTFTEHFSMHPIFQEQYDMRPNGPRKGDKLNHGIYVKDMNGDCLDLLTPKLLKDLEITLTITNQD